MSVIRDFWFARRHPLGAMRGGMAPLSWKGWALRVAFLAALAAAAEFGLWVADHSNTGRGLAAFAIFGFGAWLGYSRVVHAKGDYIRTVQDHRNESQNA